MSGQTKLIMPNGNISASPGVHQYAICATTAEGIRRQTDDFHLRLMNLGGHVIDEQRRRLSQGSTYILYTYEI